MPEPVKKRGKKPGQHRGGRKQGTNIGENFGIALIFDLVFWSKSQDPLPPEIRAKVNEIKAKRLEHEEHNE